MDTVQMQSEQLANTLKSKYKLDKEQSEVLDYAIATYDYFQNEGVIFTKQTDILDCFMTEDCMITPKQDTIYALCEYIIETIKFYPLWESYADIRAKEILKNKEV